MKFLNLLKKIYIIIYKFMFQTLYTISTFIRRDDHNKFIIAINRSDKLEGNLKFIYQEILNQSPNAKIHLVYGQNKMNLRLFKEVFILSNASYLILDDYYLPIYLLKLNHDLKVVQLWHAASAMKKFGYSTTGTKFGPSADYLKLVPIHSNYTHVYISANKFKKYYAEAFNMKEDNIYPFGIPRIDLFQDQGLIDHTMTKIYHIYPFLKNQNFVNILVAPTYRAKGNYIESKLELVDALIAISNIISHNVNIIFKPHPYMDMEDIKLLDESSNVLIAREFTINEWMLVADAFLTDYSSAIFDFSLLERPMAHFIPDHKEYSGNRGLYQRIENLSSGIIIQDATSLLDWINARKSNEHFETSQMINYNFDNIKDVSQKIVKHFISE